MSEQANGAIPTTLAAQDAKMDYMSRVYKMTHAELFHELMRVHSASAQMIKDLESQVEELKAKLKEQDGDDPS
jgi:hypothetical protein